MSCFWLLAGCGDSGNETAGTLTESAGTTSDGTTSNGMSETGDSTTATSTPTSTTEPLPTSTDDTGQPTTTESTDTATETGGNSECDPSAQDCPEGSKCTAYGKIPGDPWNANKCVPEPDGGGAIGDPCAIEGDDMFTGIDNCSEGTICLNTDAEQKNGYCVEFCTPDMQCPGTQGGTGICIVTNDGSLPICLFTCDPLVQDCLGNAACYGDASGPPFICFNPDPKDGGMDGDPCGFTNACLEGLSCADAATQEGCLTDQPGCCAPFCALDEMSCTGGEECVPFFTDQQPGYENLGVCALPD